MSVLRLAVISGALALSISFTALSYTYPIADARAADGQEEKYPYGGSKRGAYGEKKTVSTPGEARKVLREYFSKKDIRIGEPREKDLYFEAEIMDKNNNPIDKVIVDKRTGRIRSIY